ncbi:LuxR family transcriptional regulator [Pseudonocardia humida]|uniref:Helix-turn-helix domain-containing protein n=1 Tax=Pseudonocardia humida TaxID=2800819 RepID=A0ABT1A7T2_9PSEU|nr:LuxR family transcriptional regulator [Pseudonocardia humida]MCO1659015.1 helix-turn-helix domain-containing protein [Pseudonocardia humida]
MLVGREAECARLRELVEAARAGRSGALVLRGEAGAGKTALLDAVVDAEVGTVVGTGADGADDLLVLRAHGVESESELPYAGLHQLLRPVLRELDGLAAPQADALRAAFGLRVGHADERFLVSLAVLSLLGELSERRPVLCVVDDAHWLDRGSIDALAFVARRLEAERVALVLAVRDPAARPFPVTDLAALPVGPLEPGAVDRVLQRHGGGPVHPDVRLRLGTATGGNALALAELGRALTREQLSGEQPLPEPLPVTAGVEQAFLDRVRRLPEETRTALLVAAADDTGRLATVAAAAARRGVAPDALAPAEQAGVVAVDGGAVRFRHPLVRSAVHQGTTSTERRAAHLALAAVLREAGDADRAAWHRAAAAFGPDPEVAGALVEAAHRARARGAYTAAAAALTRAADLVPDRQCRAHLLTEAAYHSWRSGRGDAARRLLDQARPLTTDPFLRADIDRLHGVVELGAGVSIVAYRLLRRAAEEIAAHDPVRALEMLALAGEAGSMASDAQAEIELGELAAGLDVGEDPRPRFFVDLLVGLAHHFAGDPAAAAAPLTRALALAHDLAEPGVLLAAGRAAMYLGDDAAAHRFSAATVHRARESGEVGAVPIAGQRLALSELFAGRWAAGEATATEALRLAHDTGQEELMPLAHDWIALHAALRGHDEACRANVERARAIAASRPMGLIEDSALWALGLLDLGRGEPAAALTHLRPIRHPVVRGFSALDRIEAAHQGGDLAAARAWLAEAEQSAAATGQPWALARAAHARGLLADGADADAAFTEALGHHERADRPFERARTELAFGVALRRARRRADARRHLRPAFDAFEQLGAVPWAERAQAELRACGQTVRRRDAASTDRLTPQELQVARFVAEGLTNADVAARLFLSRRTVDFHLRNVFTKLGISSRTELVRFVVDGVGERGAAG